MILQDSREELKQRSFPRRIPGVYCRACKAVGRLWSVNESETSRERHLGIECQNSQQTSRFDSQPKGRTAYAYVVNGKSFE